METFIRPNIRTRGVAPKTFVSTSHGGATISQWVELHQRHSVVTGTDGLVGLLCRKMDLGFPACEPKEFIPPYEYEFYAVKIISKDERTMFIKKCEEWFEAHPPKNPAKIKQKIEYDHESLAKFWQYKTSLPSIEERVVAMRHAMIPAHLIERHIASDRRMDETSAERQAKIDEVFGKYSSSKPVAKPKRKSKILKPVKKKIAE